MPTILLTNQYSAPLQALIRTQAPSGFDLVLLDKDRQAEIMTRMPEVDYLLVGGRLPINRNLLEAAPRLRMIQRSGVGLDAIDLNELKSRGIPLYVNPGVNAQSVAEHTVMLMLAALRRLPAVHDTLKAGHWIKHELGIRNRDLCGRRVGLIGLGHIGLAVARLLKPFQVELAYSKPNRLSAAAEADLGIHYRPLDDLLAWSEIVSLHCPLTPATRGLLDARRLALLPAGAVLVNTARGALVDEEAMLAALQSGQLGAASLDVYANEPLPVDSPLRALDNVVLTPHIGGITHDTFVAMMQQAFRNIVAYDQGDYEAIASYRVC
ncbi:MAG: 2-hydroxyacid dehydrogenase [Wenzhouxiangella sp.]